MPGACLRFRRAAMPPLGPRRLDPTYRRPNTAQQACDFRLAEILPTHFFTP